MSDRFDKNKITIIIRDQTLFNNLAKGYENSNNMYVVRPAYLMTFLNMISSLTMKFADILMSQDNELGLKTKYALIQEFDSIKNTYLDKPLDMLEKEINGILDNTDDIRTAVQKIDSHCLKVNESYINQIEAKISRFEIQINKITKRLPETE